MQSGIHTGGEDLGYPPQKYFPPPPNPFSIDIIWHNYNKIRLFFCLKKYFIEVHIAYAWSFNCYLHASSAPSLSLRGGYVDEFL